MEFEQPLNLRQPVVHYPQRLEHEKFKGQLYGYFHADSNEYNVIAFGERENLHGQPIGVIAEQAEHLAEGTLIGIWEGEQLVFRQANHICQKRPYNVLLDIFSRNTGILETDMMLNTSVIISGVGSVGSLVALELARSGVGNFLLVDNDTFSYHNICRHQLGIHEVGRFKVNAVKDRILQINPSAKVMTEVEILENVSKATFDSFVTPSTVIVGCADNREGDIYANRIAALYKIPFVSIGFWERACAGEIFYAIPGEMPCYECVFGGANQHLSFRTSTNRRFYTTEEDLSKTRFEPGISTDINFITTVGIKLILELLNRKSEKFTPRLLGRLTQFTLICNTNNPQIGGEQVEIFSYPLQITSSIKIDYADNCQTCKITNNKNVTKEGV